MSELGAYVMLTITDQQQQIILESLDDAGCLPTHMDKDQALATWIQLLVTVETSKMQRKKAKKQAEIAKTII